MSPEKQRIAIAEACGWTFPHGRCFATAHYSQLCRRPNGDWATYDQVPNFLSDLNAMHEAEKFVSSKGVVVWQSYLDNLAITLFGESAEMDGSYKEVGDMVHATATQRAEAFLRTIGKWEEDKS